MIVGLTGGIGSGKTTVSGFFEDLGIPVYNSDVRAKELMATDALKKELIALFGKKAFTTEGLNRKYISQKVFQNKTLLESLNKIVHPAVREDFYNWALEQESPYLIQETALIFENDIQSNYDYIILVTAPIEIRVNRVIQRDGVSREQVMERMNNQLPEAKKIENSDFVIENLDLERTKRAVAEIHENLLKKAITA